MKKHLDFLPQLNTVWLTIDDFKYLCFDFAREYMTYEEPIPDYSTRDNALLESALGLPQQTYEAKLLYPTLIEQATVLFYSLIKNHPFKNGNKRIGVMSLLIFLALNNKWLSILPYKLYKFACSVAESSPNSRDKTLVLIQDTIREYIIPFPQSTKK